MLYYNSKIKQYARQLRSDVTDTEQVVWSRLHGKQVGGVQFCWRALIGQFIVDFYCPKTQLVVEVYGSQHFEPEHRHRDQGLDAYFVGLGLQVLRFDDRQVLQELDALLEVIYCAVVEWMENSLSPLIFQRGND